MVKIAIPKSSYKANGKAWIARVDDEGKIQGFERGEYECTNGTGRGCYEWLIHYALKDGRYVAHYPYSKSKAVRQYFSVKNGKVIFERWAYVGEWDWYDGAPGHGALHVEGE